MELRPLRLEPGADLRRALESTAKADGVQAFVVSGIGSLINAKLRLAGETDESLVAGPLEILTLAGSLSADGAHLHMSVATAEGAVLGGHVCYGNEIRTTAEILLAVVAGWQLSREFDTATGFQELVIRRKFE